MARINPDGTITDDCPIGPSDKTPDASGEEPPFVVFERETRFAGRHGTESGDDPVFDELYDLAAREHAELKAARSQLAAVRAVVDEMDKLTHICDISHVKCVGWRQRLREIIKNKEEQHV